MDVSQVLERLREVTWPLCQSRRNVRPDDMDAIKAFPMGLISYYHGLMCSNNTKKHADLCLKLNLFMKTFAPRFRYTTIQLNFGYASKLHVDSNNLGPSMIIALGKFDGGRLWIHDVNGNDEMTLTNKLKGWPDPAGTEGASPCQADELLPCPLF